MGSISNKEPRRTCRCISNRVSNYPRPLTTHETFLHYFQGATTAYGILIGCTRQFEAATELQALRRRKGGFHPPQSYRYVGSEELGMLVDCSSSLKSIRRTLPCEDTLLAAQCLAKVNTLVADNDKHFNLLRPHGLVVENPLV